MKRVLVSGGDGRFASKLKESKDFDVLAPPKNVMDVQDFEEVDYLIDMAKPDYFIHAAALTRPMSLHEEDPQCCNGVYEARGEAHLHFHRLCLPRRQG